MKRIGGKGHLCLFVMLVYPDLDHCQKPSTTFITFPDPVLDVPTEGVGEVLVTPGPVEGTHPWLSGMAPVCPAGGQ
jgi:hypothetical protein